MRVSFHLTAPQAYEYQEQTALFTWAGIEARRDPRLKLLNSSQNGLPASSIQAAARAKKAGMKRGFPDLFLPVASGHYHGLMIELKRVGGTPGDTSPDQAWWLEQLNAQGYQATVAYGWQEGVAVIQEYLGRGGAMAARGGRQAPEDAGASPAPALQTWEGRVMDIGADYFTARFAEGPITETDFPLDDVADEDRQCVKVGAVFRWTIGYERSAAGAKRRVSEIILRGAYVDDAS